MNETNVNERQFDVPNALSSSTASCYTPVIEQAGDTYCGFACMQEVLAALSLDDKIPGSSDAEKQEALRARQTEIHGSSDTAVVYCISKILNEYLQDAHLEKPYTYCLAPIDTWEFGQKIYNSLVNGRPVILRANTQPLDYYEGNKYEHYVVVDFIDMERSLVEIVDSFKYGENTEYQGYHMVSLQEAYDSLFKFGKYNENSYMIYLKGDY